MNDVRLPVKRALTLVYIFSLSIALLMTVVSVMGIVYQSSIYPAAQVSANVGTDALNLLIGLPMLLLSLWLMRRGNLMGLLLLPGALLYVLYIYSTYLLSVPFSVVFLPYVILTVLSAYTLIGLLVSLDNSEIQQRLTGVVPAKVIGAILSAIALLFVVMDVSAVVTALANLSTTTPLMYPNWVIDFTVAGPPLFIGGILLWRRQGLGYAAGAGLLLFIGVLFIGVPISLILGALLTGFPVDASSIVIFPIGVIPLALIIYFVRGASSNRRSSTLQTARQH